MKYEIKSKKTGRTVEVTYGDEGLIKGLVFGDGNDQNSTEWLLTNIPTKEPDLQYWMPDLFEKTVIVEKITFDDFWEAYGHKVGKLNAEKHWNKLSMSDRAKAIKMAPRYKAWCQQMNPPRRLKDPERYLSNRTFDDNFNHQ